MIHARGVDFCEATTDEEGDRCPPLRTPLAHRIRPALASMADFSDLPHRVLLLCFEHLTGSSDSVRNLCASASVCPSWREAAKEPCLWRVLWVNKAPLSARLTGRRLRNLVARSHNTLTRLWLKGCPLLNDAMLARAVQQQPCLVYVRVNECERISHNTWPTLCATLRTSWRSWSSSTTLASLQRMHSAAALPCTRCYIPRTRKQLSQRHKRLVHWTLCCAVPHCTLHMRGCRLRAAGRWRSTCTLPSAPRLPPTLPLSRRPWLP